MGQAGHRLPHHRHLGRLDQLILGLQQGALRLLALHHLLRQQPVVLGQLAGPLRHPQAELPGRQLLAGDIRDGDDEPVPAPLLEAAQIEVQKAGRLTQPTGQGTLAVAEPVQRLARPELIGQHRPRLCREGLPQRLARFDAGLLEQGERTRVDRLYGAIWMAGDEAGLGVVDEVEGIGPLHLLQLQAEVAQAVAQPADLVPAAGADWHVQPACRHPVQLLSQQVEPLDQPAADQHHQHEDAEQQGECQHHQDHQLAGRHQLAAVLPQRTEGAVGVTHHQADPLVITRYGVVQTGPQGRQLLVGQHIRQQQPVQRAVRLHQGDDILQDLTIAHGRGVLRQPRGQRVYLVNLVADEQEGALQILLIALGDHLAHQRLQLILLEGEILQGGELLDDVAKFAHVVRAGHHAGQMPLHLLQQRGGIVHQILVQPVAALLQLLQGFGVIDLLLEIAPVIRHQRAQRLERLALRGGLIPRGAQQVGALDVPQGGGHRVGEALVLHRVPGIAQLGQQQQQAGTGPLKLVGTVDGGQALFHDEVDLPAQPIPHHIGGHAHGTGQGRDGHEGEDEPPPQSARHGQHAPQPAHGLAACSTRRCASCRRASVA